MRRWVGPSDDVDYENALGTPILDSFEVPQGAYESVFDFGCGCGRQARQLLQQTLRPRRYIGIDVNPALIDWCRENLTPVDSNFKFLHHDVYSPWYAPGNSLRLSQPFPAEDASVSLLVGTSVFTHLSRPQVEYYLGELARVLRPDGIAYTTWFFFDRASIPCVPELYSLYTSEIDFGQAVLFDREWFLAMIRSLGLAVRQTVPPGIPGFQWIVFLEHRTPDSIDRFPIGLDGAEWVSGATLKAMAEPSLSSDMVEKHRRAHPVRIAEGKPGAPPLFGALAQLHEMQESRAWAIGRALTSPVRRLRAFVRQTRSRPGREQD